MAGIKRERDPAPTSGLVSSRRKQKEHCGGPGGHLRRPLRPTTLLVIVVLGFLGIISLWRADAEGSGTVAKAWFAGYVDVTTSPPYNFEDPGATDGESVMLAFIVADPSNLCTPSWGAAYTLDEAQTALDLDRRITSFRKKGGSAAVSFGGSVNSELAAVCSDTARIQSAYRDVVTRYALSTVDFDLEGESLADTSAGQRRAAAVARLQKERNGVGKPLSVWLTLPASPQGLTDAGVNAVDQMLGAGVHLSGVNLMTMNYGASRGGSQSMFDATTAAAVASHDQLSIVYQRAGMSLSSQSVWEKLGLTPMIGRNDLPGEIFDLDAARSLNSFALDKGIQRISMWSLNRDKDCTSSDSQSGTASHMCSGIEQHGVRFGELLGAGLMGQVN